MVIDFIRLVMKVCVGLLSGTCQRRVDSRPFRVRALCLFIRFLLEDSLRKGVPWLRSRQLAFSRLYAHSYPVTFFRVDTGGVPSLKCLPRGLETPARCIVYLHGGGYVTGSAEGCRDILAQLSLAANATVLGIDYRLAPESAYPAAHHDCLVAIRHVIEQAGGASFVALAGDSAGGTLCVATMIALRDAGLALPSACVLMSPWVDPSARGGSMIDRLETDILTPEILNYWGNAYLQGADPGCPEVNLSLAHLNGLPPVLVQYGEAEIFHDQIQTFVSRLQAAGVQVSLSGYANQFLVFQSCAGLLLSGRLALHDAGVFLSRYLP